MPTEYIEARVISANNTATLWTSSNPVLKSAEFGIEIDTKRMKLGDGSTAWNSLPYFGGGGGGTPSLQDVLNNGDTAANDAGNAIIGLYDLTSAWTKIMNLNYEDFSFFSGGSAGAPELAVDMSGLGYLNLHKTSAPQALVAHIGNDGASDSGSLVLHNSAGTILFQAGGTGFMKIGETGATALMTFGDNTIDCIVQHSGSPVQTFKLDCGNGTIDPKIQMNQVIGTILTLLSATSLLIKDGSSTKMSLLENQIVFDDNLGTTSELGSATMTNQVITGTITNRINVFEKWIDFIHADSATSTAYDCRIMQPDAQIGLSVNAILKLPLLRNGTFALQGDGISPNVNPDAGAGTGATAVMSAGLVSDDVGMYVEVQIGSSPIANSTLFTVTFHTPFSFAPRAGWCGNNKKLMQVAPTMGFWIGTITPTQLQMNYAGTPTPGDVLLFYIFTTP